MRVLVTGGNGFIGTYVCEELAAQGHEPLVLDHERDRTPKGPWDVILGDVRDDVIVTEAAAHAEGIVHLAAVLGTAETIDNPRPSAHTNVLGSLNIFEAAVQYDLPCVYAAVGNHFMRSTGGGSYTVTKSCAEDFTVMFNKHRGGRINVVRPMNAYGPRQSVAAPYGTSKVRKITPAFVCRALAGEPIEIYGDGEQISDMVYVEDVAKTFVHALNLSNNGFTLDFAIECGPPDSATVNEVAQTVGIESQRYTGHGYQITHIPMRRGETPNATVSADQSTLDRAGVHWDFVTLDDGMERTVKWFAENEGTAWRRPE